MNVTSKAWARPQTLVEVAFASTSMHDFHAQLRDFLHAFKAASSCERIADEPRFLRAQFAEGELADAYLAAVAVELSLDLGRAGPAWTRNPERVLKEPWFAAKSDDLRAVLLHESPAGFRERNLFVSENALSVA
jgi:hypothetical protein